MGDKNSVWGPWANQRERPGKGPGREDSRGPGAQGSPLLEGASLPFPSVASGSQPSLPALRQEDTEVALWNTNTFGPS